VTSPHLRAKLGQVVYFVFTPPSARGSDQNRFQIETYRTTSVAGQNGGVGQEGPHHQLLESHREAQAFLAPALLLLYGDVQSTGYYEILSHRRCIMVVLKHLWTLESHRAAFRAISLDKIYFISFANGLLNETNSLVGSVMDTLAEIRVTQLQMQNTVQWAALSEEERKEKTEKHEQNENEVRAKAELCMETIHMLNYLTSEEDESLRLPFLVDEILPRFSSMLLNVIRLLVGAKGLAIKVDNMESYNFKPKELLQEICVIMTHFDTYEVFFDSLAADGFIADSDGKILLHKALQTVQKLHLLTPMEIEKMTELVAKVAAARANYKDIDALTDEAPEHYLDPLMATIMRDPVLLPTSGNIVDRATITTQLLQTSIDPFNRKPLSIGQVEPQDELREEIQAWLLSHGID
jgi:ubiquitin conjugation factor E4 B